MLLDIHVPNIVNTLVIHEFQIGIFDTEYCVDTHFHKMYEILCCWEGSVTEWLNNEAIAFQTGDWLFIKPGERHRTHNHSKGIFSYLTIHFNIDDAELRQMLHQVHIRHIPKKAVEQSKLPEYARYFETLANTAIANREYRKDGGIIYLDLSGTENLVFQAHVLLSIAELIRLIESERDSSAKPAKEQASASEIDLANRMATILEDDIDMDISIGELSINLGWSRSQCTRIFKKVYGVSPRQYLSDVKTKKAKELILHSGLSVEEISDKLGFESVSHFSRQFKRWTGRSPSSYRTKFDVNSNYIISKKDFLIDNSQLANEGQD